MRLRIRKCRRSREAYKKRFISYCRNALTWVAANKARTTFYISSIATLGMFSTLVANHPLVTALLIVMIGMLGVEVHASYAWKRIEENRRRVVQRQIKKLIETCDRIFSLYRKLQQHHSSYSIAETMKEKWEQTEKPPSFLERMVIEVFARGDTLTEITENRIRQRYISSRISEFEITYLKL